MRLVDNLDMYKISDEIEFQPDQNIGFGVTCPSVPKEKAIFDFVRSIASLVLIETL